MILRMGVAFVLFLLAQESLSAQSNHSIRVRVLSNVRFERATFASGGSDSLTITEAGELIARLSANEPAVVEQWQGMLRVRWSRGSVPLNRTEFGGAESIRVTIAGGPSRLYRGTFEATLDPADAGNLQIVNIVDLEHYVASVLPSEYPFTEIEGVRAQAIVIRTYATTATSRNGSEYRLRDDAESQVYRGVEAETDLSRTVAAETAGSLIFHRGRAIEAVYSSHCGGHSANNEDIWGTNPIPYLRGRKDSYDGDSPVAEWSTSADADDVHDRLSKQPSPTSCRRSG